MTDIMAERRSLRSWPFVRPRSALERFWMQRAHQVSGRLHRATFLSARENFLRALNIPDRGEHINLLREASLKSEFSVAALGVRRSGILCLYPSRAGGCCDAPCCGAEETQTWGEFRKGTTLVR